ncbi:hypothetical protein DFQ01_103466 [Paenibacillus cellulosilyticus]|uniref:Uncharacterized protein n=1 Tax=Paenibacillus cellulosilyticus TaxID=375489 RepID=A0A2V2YXU3_9BACL|nr:peptide ABC transporter substrate-binding protein [Paenibacillus cellulosilyticus]PWW06562.1 hypothetical protein DFQ01_103466 [Paenibacillus cellulosilyticus]QKS46104.1 peptide ABC transporter substrate-binding protein [Paenibacillus cellulosilyticus]
MRRLLAGVLVVCMLLAAAACSNASNANTRAADRGELYSLALDAMMPEDEGMNSGMKYIAIDMSMLVGLDAGDKAQMIKYFAEKYKIEAMEATYEQLIEQGRRNEQTQVLDGVLLRVEKTEMTAKRFTVESSKYRAGDGAIGMKVVVEYTQGKWKLTRAERTWVS